MTRLSALCPLPLWLTVCSSTAVSQPSAAAQTVDEARQNRPINNSSARLCRFRPFWLAAGKGAANDPPVSAATDAGRRARLPVCKRPPAGQLLLQQPHKLIAARRVTLRADCSATATKRLYLERVD